LRKGWFTPKGEWGYGCRVSRVFSYTHSYALEHYEDLADIKRAIVHTNVLQPEVSVFVSLFWWTSILMVGHLLQPSHNRAVHGLYVGDAPSQHSLEPPSCDPDRCKIIWFIRPVKLTEMFESFKTFEGEHQLHTKIMMFTLSDRSVLLPRFWRRCWTIENSFSSVICKWYHATYVLNSNEVWADERDVVDLAEGADNTRTVNLRNEYGKELGLDFSNLTSVISGLDTLEVDLWILAEVDKRCLPPFRRGRLDKNIRQMRCRLHWQIWYWQVH
jgi:hypothetical protein